MKRSLTHHISLAWILLALAMLVYSVAMSQQVVLRYDAFKATAFDLGNMDQVLWNTIHGRPFQFTNQGVDWYGPPTRLAIHFEPIILPLSLLYLFHADPRILLIFQTLALVSGALPVFLLTRTYVPAWPLLAPTMAITYLAMPASLSLNLFDFHPVSLATPLLLYALLALTYKRYGWFIIACILAASCKEEIPLVIAMLGILVIWHYKLPRLGTILLLGGLFWSLLAFLVIIPHFYPGVQHNNYWYRYETLGSSPKAAVINLLLHPWLFFSAFITLDRLYYLASLFRSAGFLSLLAPIWLLPALPSFAVNLLSTNSPLYSGVYHYNAAIVPFVMLSAIHGSQRLCTLWQRWRGETSKAAASPALPMIPTTRDKGNRIIVGALLARALHAMTLIRFIVGARITPAYKRFNQRMIPLARTTPLLRLQWFTCMWIVAMLALNIAILIPLLNIFLTYQQPGRREQHIEQLLAMIPPDASVSAGQNLNPHLSERPYVTVFPAITFSTSKNRTATVQYIIVDTVNLFREDRVSADNELNQLVNSKQFRILQQAEGVILLVRRSA